MRLDLITSWRNLRRLEQFLKSLNGEIANANTSDLAFLDEFFHRGPCILDRNISEPESLGYWVDWSESFVCVFECYGPVHLHL